MSYSLNQYGTARLHDKSRGIAIVLALFFGGLGIHRFYLNRPGSGIMYLLFCWTFIPAFIALIEIILMLVTSNMAFDQKYNYS